MKTKIKQQSYEHVIVLKILPYGDNSVNVSLGKYKYHVVVKSVSENMAI